MWLLENMQRDKTHHKAIIEPCRTSFICATNGATAGATVTTTVAIHEYELDTDDLASGDDCSPDTNLASK